MIGGAEKLYLPKDLNKVTRMTSSTVHSTRHMYTDLSGQQGSETRCTETQRGDIS